MYDAPKEELINLTGKKKEVTSGGDTQVTDGVMQNQSGGNYVSDPVKTGDTTNLWRPFILMVLSGGILVTFVVGRRRKCNKS